MNMGCFLFFALARSGPAIAGCASCKHDLGSREKY